MDGGLLALVEVFIQEHLKTIPVLNRVAVDGRIASRSAALIGSALAGYGVSRGRADSQAVRVGVTLAHWGLRKSVGRGYEVSPEMRRGGFAVFVTRHTGSPPVQ